jgi:hypothetical protein
LAAFSDAVGATFKQGSAVCNAGEMCGPSTQTTVVVDGQPVIPTAEATVSLGNANYLVHVSSSFSPGAGADLSRCTDAGPLYATRVTLEVAGAAER